MRDNLTIKQETFCQEYITNGGNASEAYRKAYDASNMKPEVINVKASELLNNGKVTVRVKELKEVLVERFVETAETIAIELNEARALAMTEKQVSAAISASMGKAKLFGLIIDKAEVENKTTVVMDYIRKNGVPVVPDL